MKVSEQDSNGYHNQPNIIGRQVNQGIKDLKNDLIKENTFINAKLIGTDYNYKHKIVWENAIAIFILHLLSLWGLFIAFTEGISWKTVIWCYFVGYCGGEGITIGAHRLYTHKSFKAKPVLRALLVSLQTMAGQNSLFVWCRDHRLHHRYTDTDADPHNINRGFFFSHMGWLISKKHPYVKELGRKIDMSDLNADPIVQFQKKYFYPLYLVSAVIIPVAVPVIYFGETLLNSFLIAYALRYVVSLHTTWLVNSVAHIYGTRPYDKNLQPVESLFVTVFTLGEGWHNYHHVFPWDYNAAEIGMPFNISAKIINFFAWIGLAYDLKTASEEMVKNRIKKTGDGTHHALGNDEARAMFTAIGPVHPLNPTFTTKLKAPDTELTPEGLPLFQEDDTNMRATKRNLANVVPLLLE